MSINMWHYQVIQRKNHVALVERIDMEDLGTADSEDIIVAQDIADLIDTMCVMLKDIHRYPPCKDSE